MVISTVPPPVKDATSVPCPSVSWASLPVNDWPFFGDVPRDAKRLQVGTKWYLLHYRLRPVQDRHKWPMPLDWLMKRILCFLEFSFLIGGFPCLHV